MKAEILNLLNEDARMSLNDLALRTGATPEQVKEAIAALENEGVIRGYKVILNEKDLGVSKVRALIEVKVTPRREGGFDQVAQRIARYPEVTDLYLISGGFDLLLMVEGDSYRMWLLSSRPNFRRLTGLSRRRRDSCSRNTRNPAG